MTKVYAIVLNWCGYSDTTRCVRSLLKQAPSGSISLKVLVVDNASPDGSGSRLAKQFESCPRVRCLANPSNLGFAGGMNAGMRVALEEGADYIFVLNQDAFVEEEAVERLVEAASADPSIGAAGPRIVYASEPQKIWHGAGYFNFIKAGVVVPEKNKPVGSAAPRVRDASFLTGCALLIRAEVLKRVGFLDEDYFLYVEDLDFCWRLRKMGYRLVYVPGALVYHDLDPQLRDRMNPVVLYHRGRSCMVFLRKHFPVPYVIYGFLFQTLVGTLFRLAKGVKAGQPLQLARAWLEGLRDGLFTRISRAKPRVAIAGLYGRGNLGDELILKGVLDALNRVKGPPPDRCVVLSASPEETARYVHVRAVKRHCFSALAAVMQSRWLIIGGGGLFPGTVKSAFYYLLLVLAARRTGGRVSILGVGVNPLQKLWARVYLAVILNLSDDIVVRDKDSLERCRALTRRPVGLGTDFALVASLEDMEIAQPPAGRETKTLGFAVKGRRLSPDYLAAIGALFRRWLAGGNRKLRLIVSFKRELDLVMGRRLYRIIDLPCRVELWEAGEVGQWIQGIAGCDLLLTQRLHPALVAARCGIPVLALTGEPKIRSFGAVLGWSFIDRASLPKMNAELFNSILEKAYRNAAGAQSELNTEPLLSLLSGIASRGEASQTLVSN
ncbi:polysaccharide pyruvyl transferase family protein [Calderihabitans maritimus]|uniref:Uncharacterized protein n=1 Tax=Calderihabitans maritimus TaxID=1246530 RepID=A0A1Z5HX08_9FIRM|nr:polysaccharide pyruvyl transferase family protein [Calderihabitans maritimus]GAW94069.1 hypothetical protein KKC1_31870 [Calderihabitans maritimus]